MIIKLLRHGQSESNARLVMPSEIGDHRVALTDLGKAQARQAGVEIGQEFLDTSLIYCSPYRRARETLSGVLSAHNMTEALAVSDRVYEDPRLREVDHGYDEIEEQKELRKRHGWFYYRFRGGESPADCYDRVTTFLDSMMRQVARRKFMFTKGPRTLIVTHGLTIRCFVMRFLHLTVEQFESLDNPDNCDVITIAHHAQLEGEPIFSTNNWGVTGIRLRDD